MATPEDIEKAKRLMHPDLAKNLRVDVWLELADVQVNSDVFGAAYPHALALMAQHIGCLENRGADGNSGAVTSVREGDLSVSYAQASGGDSYWNSTSYGQQYQALLRQYSRRPGITGGFMGVTGGHCI